MSHDSDAQAPGAQTGSASQNMERIGVWLVNATGACVVVAVLTIVGGFLYTLHDALFADDSNPKAASELHARVWDSDYGVRPPIYDLAIVPSSARLYHRDFRGRITSIDPLAVGETSNCTRPFDECVCDQMRLSSVREQLALAFRDGSLVLHFPNGDEEDIVLERERSLKSMVNCLSYSSDGTLLAKGTADGIVGVFETRRDRSNDRIFQRPDGQVVSLAFAGNEQLYLSTDRQIEHWDLSGEPKKLRALSGLQRARELLVTPDHRFLICGSLDGKLQCWNLDEDKLQWEQPAISPTCRGLALAPDGRFVTASRCYNLLEVFEIESGIAEITFESEMQFVNASVYSSDGSILYSACTDGTIHIWSIPNQSAYGFIDPESLRF